ncbi:MarR family transcriptional regulator [Alicyclobacillaceae bacterium I2511]|nr:MarR family transcriptional regulator [Alicyclobacillaceae bacterium I2511]
MAERELPMELFLSYRELYQEWRGLLRTCAQEAQLSELQLIVLKMLNAHSELGVNAVATAVMCSQSQASMIITQLSELGLVERMRSDTDRRRVHLRVTSEGVARLALIFGPNSLLMNTIVRVFSLPEAELEDLLRLNRIVMRNLQLEGVN